MDEEDRSKHLTKKDLLEKIKLQEDLKNLKAQRQLPQKQGIGPGQHSKNQTDVKYISSWKAKNQIIMHKKLK
ncbi:MAG TPA: hypothetical protein P5513_05275 [Candidatus Diapherotrites archaeon]|nr:hypothetical protein [Candidatus Diapherotrites archaeon]